VSTVIPARASPALCPRPFKHNPCSLYRRGPQFTSISTTSFLDCSARLKNLIFCRFPRVSLLCCVSVVGEAALTVTLRSPKRHSGAISHHPSSSGHSNVIRSPDSHQHSGRIALPTSIFLPSTFLNLLLTASSCDETISNTFLLALQTLNCLANHGPRLIATRSLGTLP